MLFRPPLKMPGIASVKAFMNLQNIKCVLNRGYRRQGLQLRL